MYLLTSLVLAICPDLSGVLPKPCSIWGFSFPFLIHPLAFTSYSSFLSFTAIMKPDFSTELIGVLLRVSGNLSGVFGVVLAMSWSWGKTTILSPRPIRRCPYQNLLFLLHLLTSLVFSSTLPQNVILHLWLRSKERWKNSPQRRPAWMCSCGTPASGSLEEGELVGEIWPEEAVAQVCFYKIWKFVCDVVYWFLDRADRGSAAGVHT